MYSTFPIKQVAFVITTVKVEGSIAYHELYRAAEDNVNIKIQSLAEKLYKKNFVVLDISDYQIGDHTVKTRVVYQYDASVDDTTGKIKKIDDWEESI